MRLPTTMTSTAAIIAACAGCANRELTRAEAKLFIDAAPTEIIRESAATLRSRGHHVYLGNPGLTAYGSHRVTTFWSPGARILGAAVTPAFILTWPIVLILPFGGEGRMWWPVTGMAMMDAADITRSTSVHAVPQAAGICLVEVNAWSGDHYAIDDIRILVDGLTRRFPVSQSVLTPQPTDNTH